MDIEGHYFMWNKSDRERQILYDITYVRDLENIKTSDCSRKADSQIEGKQVVISEERKVESAT